MPGSLLLDTNIVIALFAGENQVQAKIAEAEITIPSTVLGELYYGARKSAHYSANLARIDEFARSVPVLACDAVTARHYGEIKSLLKAKGRPIPENDIWIAALAIQHGMRLVTRDDHFGGIEGLVVENW